MPQYDVAIIGGGISGLSALHFLRRMKPSLTVRLFEAEDRLGGTIGTDHIDGYSVDWGPNGFLDREPLTLQLCDELGLGTELERANESVGNRYILRRGKLRLVPMSPQKFLLSDILSFGGKARVLYEPFARARQDGEDETIYDFAQRRIGREAADYLIQPMVSGVYGGVAQKLSLQSCFPIMREMEDRHGSLFKAMIAKAKEAKRAGRKSGGPSGPGGWLTSFYGGLDQITARFLDLYREYIVCGKKVTGIRKSDRDFALSFSDGEEISAAELILAVPSYVAAEMTKSLSRILFQSLSKIPYAPIAVVCFGYPESAICRNVNGFGFLVPQKEGRGILGSIWTSSIFRNRAPAGKVQFRTMIGGDGDHQSIYLTDDQLVELARKDLDEILKINGSPEFVKIYRWKNGIPQYVVGHSQVMQQIENELRKLGGIHLTGNAYCGIGLNDCVKQSYRVANQL